MRPRTLRVALTVAADGVGVGTLAARLEVVQGAIRVTREGDELRLLRRDLLRQVLAHVGIRLTAEHLSRVGEIGLQTRDLERRSHHLGPRRGRRAW